MITPSGADAKLRLAVFLANYPLTISVRALVLELADRGFEVALFLSRAKVMVELDELARRPGVEVFDFGQAEASPCMAGAQGALPAGLLARMIGRLHRLRAGLLRRSVRLGRLFAIFYAAAKWLYEIALIASRQERAIIPGPALRRSRELLRHKPCRWILGIENSGLVWGGRLAAECGAPLIFQSMELDDHDFPVLPRTPLIRYIRLRAIKYHRKAAATVVQDRLRGEALCADHGVFSQPIFYLPVADRGGSLRLSSTYFQERLKDETGRRLLLYFGAIKPDRFCGELASAAQRLAPGTTLVMHGFGYRDYIEDLRAIDRAGRILFSLNTIPANQVHQAVASAAIGVVFYWGRPLNHRLTAFASEKLALYLQCGLPVIAFNYEGYETLEQYGCGVLLEDIAALPEAAQRILERYEAFSANARRCFDEVYSLSRRIEPLAAFLAQPPGQA